MQNDLTMRAADGGSLVGSVEWTESFPERCRGLLGKAGLGPGSGMVIAPCSSVHTWFMRFTLDLLFFSGDFRVVKRVLNVKPWRIVSGGMTAWGVLEVESRWFPWDRVKLGDRLVFEEAFAS